MKKIRILLIALVVILISIIMLSSNAVYATERNLTYQKTRPYSDDDGDGNIDNEEYTFKTATSASDFNYSIVKIFDSDKINDEAPYAKFSDSFYCLRAGKGFGSVNYRDNSSTNSETYTVIEDIKTNANDVIAKFKELYNVDLNRTETISFNGKEYKDVNIYNAILWIADNAYLPVSTEKYNAEEYKAELLTKIGIAKVNQSMITDDDLEVIQQLAFWYFANYDEELVSIETPVNMLAINEENDVFGTKRANYLNRIYQYFIEGALKEGENTESSIRDTENGDSVTIGFDKNTKFSVQDKSSTGTVINPYENYYLIGPFKITTSDARYNDFELVLKDGKGEEVNQYFYIEQTDDSLKRIQLFDIIDSTGNKVENIGYNQEYSIRLYKASLEFIEIDTSKFSLKVSKTGKWTTANFLYAGGEDQAVLEIKREQAVVEDEITTETPKTFDLALRKYITAIKRAGTNIEIANRTPQIDLTTLINGIKDERTGEIEYTATYKHRKDPVEVQQGDIVTYTFTVYNEGELDGYVYSITDYLPKGLELDTSDLTKLEVNDGRNYYYLKYVPSEYGFNYIYKLIVDRITGKLTIMFYGDDATIPDEFTGLDNYLFYLHGFGGEKLDSASIDVNFKVTAEETGYNQVLTNVATMDYASSPRPLEETVKDRDSKPETFTEPTAEKLLEQLPGYKGNEANKNDLTDSTYHYKGQEDDDDFEKVIIKGKSFDLALRKYIVSVNEKTLSGSESRVPEVDVTPLNQSKTTANYKHKKDPVEVQPGDIVTYRFTVYNEGDITGYVYSITDYLPKGLELDTSDLTRVDSEDENLEIWKKDEFDGYEPGSTYHSKYEFNKNTRKLTITRTVTHSSSAVNPETGMLEEPTTDDFICKLQPFDGQTLDSASIDVKFKVTATETDNDQILTNVATMSYSNGIETTAFEEISDRDSKPETFTEPTAEKLLEQLPGYKGNEANKNDLADSTYHYKGQEDDDDFEKIIIKGTPFDMSLRKFITLLNGAELDVDRTPRIDTSKLNTIDTATGNKITTAQYVHPKDAVTVRKGDIVTYKIRIYNEGERDGYATKISDYLPEGLGFLPEYTNNSIWSIPIAVDETTGTEVLPEGVEIKSLVGENGFYKDESQIDKDKIKLEDFKDPITGEVPTDYSSIQIVTGDKVEISTKALKDKLIKAYKSEKAEKDLWQESTNDKNDGLFYQEVEITCIVLEENTYTGVLKNVAEITGAKDAEGTEIINKGDDRDSEPNNVYEDDKHTPGNEENGYTPGEQDDDDFEQLKLKYFDLALRKFITKVDNEAPETSREPVPDVSTLINGTYDRNGKKEHTATYNHSKEPLWVKNGSEVEYTIRVYNEGSEDGYAYEICDDIPEGLLYDSENATNKACGWVMYREMIEEDTDISKEDIIEYNNKKYVVTTKAEEATMIRTRYLENTLIKAFDPETKVLSYADVKVVFAVKEPEDFNEDRVIINQAQITEDSGDDQDSTPNKWLDEDDEDIEKIRIPVFDLSLLKWVAQTVVTVDGKTTTTNTGFKPNQGLTESTGEDIRKNSESEPIAKVEIDKKKLSKTVVKFVYKIRVTNEGEIPGYATEVTDYIPEGLEFYIEDGNNKEYGWVKSGDDRIVTRALETVLLNPGESKELEITFRWINDEKNLGQKINIAEISEDANDYNTKDIDSVPNNKKDPYEKEQEDDDDFALVILSIKTGASEFFGYFTIVTTSLAILGIGIYLIKKYVLIS